MTRGRRTVSTSSPGPEPSPRTARSGGLTTLLVAALALLGALPAAAQVAQLNAWTMVNSSAPGTLAFNVNAGNITVAAGTNRLLVVAAVLELNNNPGTISAFNATLGGTGLTALASTELISNREHAKLWYFLNAQIPGAAAALVVSGTATQTVNGLHIYWASFSGVDQTAPINDSSANNSAAATVTFGNQVDFTTGGWTLYAAGNGGTPATQAPPAGFTNQRLITTTSNHTSAIEDTGVHAATGNFAAGSTITFGGTTSARSAVAVASLRPAPAADVSITKTTTTPVFLGDTFTYTLTVSNAGFSTATNVTVTDVLPASMRFLAATPSQGSCSGTTTVTCSLGSLASGGAATITITVQARAIGTFANTASVTATEPDPDTTDNSSTVSTTVQQINTADMTITKTGAPASQAIGSNVTYTLTVHNNGPNTANAVTMIDALPPGMTWVSTTTTVGTCAGTAIVSCSFGNMANGATATVTIVVTVGTTGTKTNTATVAIDTSTTFDPNATNNSATAVTTVTTGTAPVCSTPVLGAGGTLSGVINTYYPGTASVAAGATSITLGVAAAAPAAQVPIAIGDLLLVIQMQDATINSSNTNNYGGNNGTGAGATAVNAGRFEYVRATNAVPLAGGTLNLSGAGAGTGLLNAYTNADATAAKGQVRFQVVRVPQYTTATLNGIAAAPWSTTTAGTIGLGTGGILALDVQGALTLSDGLMASADGQGFRGGAGRQLAGSGTPCGGMAIANTDWRTPSTCNTNGGKGEGNAGTPEWVNSAAGPAVTNQPNDGYPNGSMARGAPGNAGGGSTDGNPAAANDENSGGGGGSNGGAGGTGGLTWRTYINNGGTGAAVTPAITQLVLGGGGGAGTRNNNPGDVLASGGAAGGGLIVIRAAQLVITGNPIFSADGADAYDDTDNDGGGGGGAGGSVVLTVTTGDMNGLSMRARGGKGGSTWKNQAPGTNNPAPDAGNNHHGPGGGGGGGVIVYTSTAVPPTLSVSGGIAGISTTDNSNFGAQPGGGGQTLFAAPAQVPGVGSASDCVPDPAITLTHTPATSGSGSTVAFVTTVSNAAPFISTAGVISVTITIDPGLAFSGLATGTGWTCAAPVGQSVTCTRATALAAHLSFPPINFNATIVASGPATLTNNVATVSGGGDVNTANNTDTDTVGVLAPTLARLRGFQAVRAGRVVLIRWQTSYEMRNLGFRVYRETAGSRELLTPSLIAGSALFVGHHPMSSGRSYSWVDETPGPEPVYWLEDLDVDGTRQWTGPVVADPEDAASARWVATAPAASRLLKTLGRAETARARHLTGPGLGRERLARLPKNRSRPWMIPDQRAAKLEVQHEGWYRITRATLMAAGFDPGSDPGRIQLFADGERQTLIVRDGGDDRLDPSDTLEFYGVGLESAYDSGHVYWLVKGDGEDRFDIGPIGGRPQKAPRSFPFTVERRDRTVFFAGLTNNGDNENFFGAVLTSDPVAQELAVSNLDPLATRDSALTVALQGVTTDSPHDVQVLVNGNVAGEIRFSAQEAPVQTFSVPSRWLREGANEIGLVALGGLDDISVVDFVRLTYPHLYRLDSGALRMSAPPNTRVTLTGLADGSVRVVDVTDPAHVRELKLEFGRQGQDITGSFNVPGRASATLYAFTADRALAPVSVVANSPSRLRNGSNAADLVVIAHPSLLEALRPLVELRRSQGYLTSLVDVTDVYDEFAFGQRTPYAIRTFLWQASRTWKRPPHYVLLAGDASFDPKNYLGMGDFDLVPTKFIPTTYLKTNSDDWFVDFDGNALPDMAIGRLPARDPAEASLMVAKILAHDAAALAPPGDPTTDWRRRVLLVSDRPGEFDFEAASTQVRALLPADFSVQEVSVAQLGGGTRDAIVDSMNTGQLLVNYTGHGSEDVWSQEDIFNGTDARALTNGASLPVVVDMTCLNGLFNDLYVESLAEALLKAPEGGAVAVWASSGLTEPVPQALMNQDLLRRLFQGPPVTLGDAVMRAKAAAQDQEVQRTWILFGDPTMRLR